MDVPGSIEGLPLKLLVIFSLLSLAVPQMHALARDYDRGQTEAALRDDANRILLAAEEIYFGGLGNARCLELDLSGGWASRVDYIELGGPDELARISVRYKLSSGFEERVLSDKGIQIICPDGFLRLGPGAHVLRLELEWGEIDGRPTAYVSAGLV